MAQMYERYLRVLKKWPMLPENRLSRCLGFFIRQKGKEYFSKKGELVADIKDCEERMQCLERIANNHWLNKYPRTRESSALGLTAEESGYLLTTDFLDEWEKRNSNFAKAVWLKVKSYFRIRMQ